MSKFCFVFFNIQPFMLLDVAIHAHIYNSYIAINKRTSYTKNLYK